MTENMNLPPGVELIRKIYFALAILGTLVLILGLFGITERGWEWWLQIALLCFVFWIISYGIYRIRSWVVILILFFAYLSLINGFLQLLYFKPDTSVDLFKKAFLLLMTSFHIFQIVIFSRKETRKFFKEKGATLIA